MLKKMFLANEIKNTTARILPTMKQDKEFLNTLPENNTREIANNRLPKMKGSK